MNTNRATPQRVWITGASRGLGAALVREYAATGADVMLSARDAAALTAVANTLPEAGHGHVYPLDVTSTSAMAEVIDAIESTHGAVDLAILNAGTYVETGADDFRPGDIRELFELNFFSIVETLAILMPRMRSRRQGQLAVIASVAGDIGLPYASGYSASKAALNRLCQSLRPELARDGVSINVVNPGFIATPLTAKNAFPMPFIVGVERAARDIRHGLARDNFEIRFPWRMSMAMRLLANLPDALTLAITRRMLKS